MVPCKSTAELITHTFFMSDRLNAQKSCKIVAKCVALKQCEVNVSPFLLNFEKLCVKKIHPKAPSHAKQFGKLLLSKSEKLANSCFHTTNFHLPLPRLKGSFFSGKEGKGPCKTRLFITKVAANVLTSNTSFPTKKNVGVNVGYNRRKFCLPPTACQHVCQLLMSCSRAPT